MNIFCHFRIIKHCMDQHVYSKQKQGHESTLKEVNKVYTVLC